MRVEARLGEIDRGDFLGADAIGRLLERQGAEFRGAGCAGKSRSGGRAETGCEESAPRSGWHVILYRAGWGVVNGRGLSRRLACANRHSIFILGVEIDKRHKRPALIHANGARLRDGRDFPAGRQQHGVAQSVQRAVEDQIAALLV